MLESIPVAEVYIVQRFSGILQKILRPMAHAQILTVVQFLYIRSTVSSHVRRREEFHIIIDHHNHSCSNEGKK